jgi:hypothetical protein
MPWNLVEPLSTTVHPRRAFYLPLASIPPGSDTVRPVPQNTFTPADDTTAAPDKVFKIRISPPSGGFSDEGTLPDPAYRLHAMDHGEVRFKPADSTMEDRLILKMDRFTLPIIEPLWWQRWSDAECQPVHLIYENVDRDELETRLNSISLGESFHGLTFPKEVADLTQRTQFITDFLAGNDNTFLVAEAGAVIGTAAADPAHSGDRLLKLRGRYSMHLDSSPQFMNPREFFYLLFGDDSSEATSHPLLLKMEAVGTAAAGMETKSIRLRPPLRTHARVMWESRIEIDNHATAWARSNSCLNRLYNTHSRESRAFFASGYDFCRNDDGVVVGCWKCNLFVSDIALRSGFRICITDVNPHWHYAAAGWYAGRADTAGNATNRVPLNGRVENETKTWGFKIERYLRSLDDEDLVQAGLNHATQYEGRCLILAGARAGIGHIMIVEKVNGPPKLVDDSEAGHGFKSIAVTLHEALGSGGAQSSDDTCKIKGTGGRADSHQNFSRLHLIELHPGKDPDTETGLRDCNVQI